MFVNKISMAQTCFYSISSFGGSDQSMNVFFTNLQKFSPSKVSCYTV